MPLTDFATQLADALEDEAIAQVKAQSSAWITRVRQAFDPPLTTRELSVGLGLQDPERGGSVIGRFLSEAHRNRRARPDTRTRAVLQAIVQGRLFVAVQASLPGAPRQVLIAEARDVPHMDRTWTVVNVAGHPVPERRQRKATWDDGSVFDLFDEQAPERPPAPPRRIAERQVPPIALGTLRLSTSPERPEPEDAQRTLIAALDAGVRLLDTADSYGLDDQDLHHGERLIARTLDRWDGPADQVLVVTKAGLIRPGGRWIPKGDAEHLQQAVRASAQALDRQTLPLVLLHAVDPQVPLEDSLGALHELREQGLVEHVGVCNIDAEQLERALRVGPVAAVQVELSALSLGTAREGGVVQAARAAGIPVLAHRPLGGWKRAARLGQDATLRRVAERHRTSAHAVALAWLTSLSTGVIPLVGATRVPTARDSAQAASLPLTEPDLDLLDEHFQASDIRRALRAVEPRDEVVLLMGPPAAGKTSQVQDYVERGYLRLNRDERGGRLDDLLPPLDQALRQGTRQVVLDNTYPTRSSRSGVIEVARRHGLPVRAVWLETSQRDAMLNAAHRMVERAGRVLAPDEIAAHPDPNLLPPAAIAAWFQRLEPPTRDEGLHRVERVPFVRRPPSGDLVPGLILDLDGTLRRSTGGAPFPRNASEVALLPRRRETLEPFVQAGVTLVGLTNQATVGLGQITLQDMLAAVERTVELLDLPIDVRACPHRPKDGCWCRKPRPGLGVELMHTHRLDPSRTWMIGDRAPDEGVAEALGLRFVHADVFFGEQGPDVHELLAGPPEQGGEA